MQYLSAETSCGRLWVAYRDDPGGLGGDGPNMIVCFSRLGVSEEQFRAQCRDRLGEVPEPVDDPVLAEQIQARLTIDTEVPFDLAGWTSFQRDVLNAVAAIPRGQVRTYAQVAATVGRPRAARAVGEVMRTNPIPVLIPCHRVVRSDGSIGNYTPDPSIKRKFLIEEGAIEG